MSCLPGIDENDEKRDVWTCNPAYVNITTPSESPCIFAFKIIPGQMQWSKMHSRRLELNITLQELTDFDCPDDDQPATTRRLQDDAVAPADATGTDDQATAPTPDPTPTSTPTPAASSSADEPTEEEAES